MRCYGTAWTHQPATSLERRAASSKDSVGFTRGETAQPPKQHRRLIGVGCVVHFKLNFCPRGFEDEEICISPRSDLSAARSRSIVWRGMIRPGNLISSRPSQSQDGSCPAPAALVMGAASVRFPTRPGHPCITNSSPIPSINIFAHLTSSRGAWSGH